MFPCFFGEEDYRLVNLCSMSKIHIWMSTYHICPFVTGLTHSGWFLLFPSICLWISRFHCFFLLSSTPLYKYTTFSLSLLQLRGIKVASRFWILQTMLLWTWLNICPCCMNMHYLGIYPREEWLDLEVDWFPAFWATAILISRVVVLVHTPTSNGGVFLLLHILSSIDCHWYFWF